PRARLVRDARRLGLLECPCARFARRPRARCADGRLRLLREPFGARRADAMISRGALAPVGEAVALIPGTSDYSPRERAYLFPRGRQPRPCGRCAHGPGLDRPL